VIWKQSTELEKLNKLSKGCAVEQLGIVITSVDENSMSATMPVDSRTRQPFGLLHGGASVLLAESVGSLAGNLCVATGLVCVGQSIHASHVRAVREGVVTATAKPKHLGRTSQIWHIAIEDEHKKLVCDVQLTLAVIEKMSAAG
jgi:1,4-dihydroxy-2-naphthoyl-CoA hydrolase